MLIPDLRLAHLSAARELRASSYSPHLFHPISASAGGVKMQTWSCDSGGGFSPPLGVRIHCNVVYPSQVRGSAPGRDQAPESRNVAWMALEDAPRGVCAVWAAILCSIMAVASWDGPREGAHGQRPRQEGARRLFLCAHVAAQKASDSQTVLQPSFGL